MAGGIIRKFAKSISVLCNVAIAALFLLGCYAASFNPETFWFFGLFTLAALYLLAVLLFFIVFWLFAKKKFMLISVVAIVCAWKPLGHLIKFKTATDFTLSKSPENIRIMSWNVEHFDILEHKTHPERKTEMIEMINKFMPDVACFQEMVGGDEDSTAINFVPRMAKQLNFEYYNYSYDRRDNFDNKHHYGIITFSRFPILNKETYTFGEYNYNSIFQSINIVKNTDTFSVFNIHLQSLKFSDTNRQYIEDPTLKGELDIKKSKNILVKFKTGFLKRKLQSERVKNTLDRSPYPVILCGDFNDVPNSYAYNTIGKGLKNTFTEKGSGIGRTFYGISPTLRIDNIFADERFEVEQFIRIKKKLSDHFPIITDLKLLALSNK
jgi:endonuclease/exonuclease/phosphatase family metal-dependent hydrolase